MPLIKSASKQAFKKNIKREVKAGKPIKQAVAIGYAVKRKAGGSDNFAKARLAAQRKKKPKLSAFA